MPPSKARTASYREVSTHPQPVTQLDFEQLDKLNDADMHVNYRKRHLPLTIGLIVLIIVILGVAGFTTWYFLRSNYLDTEEVLGSVKLNAHTLSGSIFTKGSSDAQFVQFGQLTTGTGSLTFSRFCTLDSARTLLKDERYRYLCLLYTSGPPSAAAHSAPDYRLLIQVNPGGAQVDFECYDVRWDLPAKYGVTDCFTPESGHVYGGGQRPAQKWPSSSQPIDRQLHVSNPASFMGFTNIVVPYWLFTTGISIMADPKNPALFVTLNSSGTASGSKKQSGFCLGTAGTSNPPKSGDSTTQTFSYSVCVGANLTHLHENSLKKYQDPVALTLDETLIQRPVWTTFAFGIDEQHNLDQDAIFTLADMLEEYGLPVSQIVIDPRWENQPGEGTFHTTFFPNVKLLFDSLKAKRITPQLMVHPYLSANTTAYNILIRDPSTKKYFARDEGAGPVSSSSLANVSWLMGQAAMLDFSRIEAVKWKAERIKFLFDQFEMQGCRFLGGSSGWLTTSNGTQAMSKYRRNTFGKFADGAAQVCGDKVTVDVAARFSRRQVRLADAVWVADKTNEDNLKGFLGSLIPSALTVSLLGHPIFVSSMIGGNPFIGPNGQLDFQHSELKYPTSELYLRWLGAVLFFPILEFSILPTIFPDEESPSGVVSVLELTRNLLALRHNHTEYLVQAARSAAQTGLSMIRPLWWSFPTDRTTWTCDNQYFVGDDLLVAPIVTVKVRTRQVYLPKGRWRNKRGQEEPAGPKWITATANLDEVPIYWRIP